MLLYDRNIFGSPSDDYGNLRLCSKIFGHFREMLGNVLWPQFGQLLELLRKLVGNLRKIVINVVTSMLMYCGDLI